MSVFLLLLPVGRPTGNLVRINKTAREVFLWLLNFWTNRCRRNNITIFLVYSFLINNREYDIFIRDNAGFYRFKTTEIFFTKNLRYLSLYLLAQLVEFVELFEIFIFIWFSVESILFWVHGNLHEIHYKSYIVVKKHKKIYIIMFKY